MELVLIFYGTPRGQDHKSFGVCSLRPDRRWDLQGLALPQKYLTSKLAKP